LIAKEILRFAQNDNTEIILRIKGDREGFDLPASDARSSTRSSNRHGQPANENLRGLAVAER
jgi:hypothetical protein